MILYYVVGYHALPDFWPLAITILVLNIAGAALRHYWGLYAFIPNLIIFSAGIAFFHKLEFRQVLKSVVIFLVLRQVWELAKTKLLS
ncbi:MAG: hypothetical protein R6U84_06445 [Candidatus Cloacimonadales bacterium]